MSLYYVLLTDERFRLAFPAVLSRREFAPEAWNHRPIVRYITMNQLELNQLSTLLEKLGSGTIEQEGSERDCGIGMSRSRAYSS